MPYFIGVGATCFAKDQCRFVVLYTWIARKDLAQRAEFFVKDSPVPDIFFGADGVNLSAFVRTQ